MDNITVETEVTLARENFLKNHEQFIPMARVDRVSGEHALVVLDVEGFEKWESLANVCAMEPAHKVVFMADVWMRSVKGPVAQRQFQESPMRVSDYADRYEAFVVNVITAASMETKVFPYHRDGDTIVWDEDAEKIPKEDGMVLSEGAMLVQSKLVTP
jgi:hypothetical protein